MFRPSHESLLLQNQEIDRMDLPRIQDDAELEQLKASEDLVPIIAGQRCASIRASIRTAAIAVPGHANFWTT